MGAVSFIQFELFWAHKLDTSRTGQYKSARPSRTCCDLTVVSVTLLPDRIRNRPTAHRTHRQPKCSAAPAHSHCMRRFYHARTVAECKYPFPTFIAYFTSALCETGNVIARSFEVIAHLWAGTAHRPTIGNNVTPDPIFNFQVSIQVRRLFLSFNHNRLFSHNKCEMELKIFLHFHFNMMCVIIVVTYLWRQNLCI